MKIENKKITTYQICLVALAVGVNICLLYTSPSPRD